MSLRHYLGAWGSLLGRYKEVFAFHWKHRKDKPRDFFTANEAEFLPAALAIQEKPISPTLRLIAWVLLLFALFAFLWALLGRMDIIVHAEGKVVLTERTKSIASVETARLTELYVSDGQTVKAGDLLFKLDTRIAEADHEKAQNEWEQAVLIIARNEALLEALDSGRAPRLKSRAAINEAELTTVEEDDWQTAQLHVMAQYQNINAQLRALDDGLRMQNRMLPIAKEQERRYRTLAQSRDVAQDAWQEKVQAVFSIEAKVADTQNQRSVLMTQTRQEAIGEIAQARRSADIFMQETVRAAASSSLLSVTSPVDGTVQQLQIHTIGGVVPAAQPLMQIVPSQGPVEVEAFMENKDIGFIHEGQTVAIKVQTFEFTKYGTVPARVLSISRDAIQEEKRGLLYVVRIALEKDTLRVNGREVPITPGMVVTADIKTGNRRVIDYVLGPLLQYSDESFKER